MRSRFERSGHWLEYLDRKTKLWIEDPELIEYWIGDGPYSGRTRT